MPDMDGFEATRQIRAWEHKHGQHIPIIAMTAHAMAGDRERCIDAGMDDYVSKPLEPRVLFNAIDRWLQSSNARWAETSQDYLADDDQNFSVDAGRDKAGENISSARKANTKLEPASDIQANPSSENLPPDLEATLYRFNGDRAFMMEMCQDFKDHLPLRLEELKSTLQNGDINNISRAGA